MRRLIILFFCIQLSGCGATIEPNANPGDIRIIHLTKKQVSAVQNGVRQVISPVSEFGSFKAIQQIGQSGVHVCGHAKYRKRELPFYMEVESMTAPPKIKRGQVGTDSSKLAIVKFMCRRHGNI